MNVNELLDTIEDALEESASVPLSGGKRIVDVEQIRDYLDEVRAALPGELRQAQQIVNDRLAVRRDIPHVLHGRSHIGQQLMIKREMFRRPRLHPNRRHGNCALSSRKGNQRGPRLLVEMFIQHHAAAFRILRHVVE